MSSNQYNRHILLVEDDQSQADLIMRVWGREHPETDCHHVSDGAEALDFLHRRGPYAESPRPVVVLLDLRIPKIDGQEVLRVIKTTERLLTIPVVILTSSEAEKDIAEAYEHHANSYLVKPVGFEAFTQMMETLGFYWLGWNVHPWKCHCH